MKKLLSLYFILIASSVLAQQQGGGTAQIRLTAEKLHARVREWPYPANGITVPDNHPALLWPGTNGKKMIQPMESGSDDAESNVISQMLYKVMLANEKDFKGELISSNEQRWAMFPLHQALHAGHWYWKYAYSVNGNGKWTWSNTYDFVVAANANNEKVAPPVDVMLKRNDGPHPRLWNMSQIGEAFYRNNLQNPEAKKFIAFAERILKEPLPSEKPMRVIDTTGKAPLEKSKIIERMYHGFGDAVGTPIHNLCIAYQLTKDQRFIQGAQQRAMIVAKMNPDGLATRDDFTSGAVLEAMGWFYDAGYAFLNQKEKELLKKAITIRARRVYEHLPNRFELHVCDNHVWQITMRNLAIGTVAVVNEVPEAKEWLTYMYEVWTARFPILGTTDGGWHEGNGYFRVNFKSFIYLSQMFDDFSGVDYFSLPWMQDLPYYMLYTYPPNSMSTAIGDMWENLPNMVKMQAWFADALTFRMNNPYLNWYVAQIKKDDPDYFKGTDDLLLFRLLNYNPNRALPSKSPDELPKTRKFADVGVVAMQQDLMHADKSLSSYLFSSPFGSSGHGHASQNAFTVNFKGKTIFGGSGYYSNFSDRHNLLYYRTSRAYCTILADSLGQKLGEEGYGWIPRTISGNHIQYALGDASNAYGDIKSDFWLDRFRQIGVVPDKSNGYGESGVKLYRRHMLQLDGGFIVLYDELEADKPVKWTTQLHTPYYKIVGESTKNSNQQNFTVENDLGSITASVFSGSPLTMTIHNQFAEPAVNWAKVTDDEGQIKVFKDQWHAGITSLPAQKFRFLTILQIKDGKPEAVVRLTDQNGIAHFKAGAWDIQAQLDGKHTAALQVINSKIGSVFNYGDQAVTLTGKGYQHHVPGSSMLLEIIGGKMNRQEAVDEIPNVAKFDHEASQ
ncbi:MAG: heparinase [Mucilaginibacter sp.]|nr:heparinase [Mucilaginibacter sp.]